MHTTDPDQMGSSHTPPRAVTEPAPHILPAAPLHTRLAGIFLLVAGVLAVIGAVLPWFTVVRVGPQTAGRAVQLFTWHVWSTGCGLLFPLSAVPWLPLVRTGQRAIRSLPLSLGRGRALRLALLGLAGALGFAVLLVLAAFYVTFDPGWGRGSRDDLLIEAGLPVTLASYLLASLASLFLPSRVSS